MYFSYFHSPFGDITLTSTEKGLSSLYFTQGKMQRQIPSDFIENEEVFTEVKHQLAEYFKGQRQLFSLPLDIHGTSFQRQVWQALMLIKQGETKSYAWIAKQINNEKAVRAVGTANGANPISLIIPCHRVIGGNGKLTGYAGGLALKAKLLMHEGAYFKP